MRFCNVSKTVNSDLFSFILNSFLLIEMGDTFFFYVEWALENIGKDNFYFTSKSCIRCFTCETMKLYIKNFFLISFSWFIL